MRLVPVYRPGTSALHAARASASCAFVLALALACVMFEHPVLTGAVVVAAITAGVMAGVGDEMWRGVRLALPVVILIAILNPLFASSQGVTLLIRGDEVFGHRFGDITLEALLYGLVSGLRFGALVLVFSLYSAVVDPDEVLKLLRRFSYRSALTASLTTRLVPVLARDASRMSDAARCRPVPPTRMQRVRAALHGSLDRAVDVAAALEVRGYANARRGARAHKPWSRHDIRVMASAVLIAVCAIGAAVAGAFAFEPYPRTEMALGPAELAISAALILLAVAPLAGARARLGVAHAG